MIKGFIAGAFDIIHPGYIQMFREAREHCDYLVIGLHINPEVNGKLKPVLSYLDRQTVLESIKYVDEVIPYSGEDGLYNLLVNLPIDVRFLGGDYRDKLFTGRDLPIPVYFLNRDHGWSTTKIKTLIHNQIKDGTNSL